MKIIGKPLYFGADYYPEDWPEAEMTHDIAMMQDAGMNVVRIGEFAWHKMEPQEGHFDFAWLHTVVDRLKAAGICVIMGTPSATPPIWLSRKHPDVLALTEQLRPIKHGGRRHCCANNPNYRQYSARIAEKLAQEFGQDENVVGWQIDNEIYMQGTGCFCENCTRGFRAWLAQKYGSIDKLNARWDLNLFSQAYDDFDEIPTPSDTWHNPHLKLEWTLFQSESQTDFVAMQADILHRYTAVPVGTDTMPFNRVDYEKLTEKCDVIQFNHYNEPENMSELLFWLDYLRTLKNRPFWNTETATCWSGAHFIAQTIKPEGWCRINSWLPVLFGGEANLYWLWRTHWAGHELMHGSVLEPCGRPMHIFAEVQRTAHEFAAAEDFINQTQVVSDTAMLFSSLSWNLFGQQTPYSLPDVPEDAYYQYHLQKWFYPGLLRAGLRPDVLAPHHSLQGYKLLFTPLLMTLEEADLAERLAAWVREGGIWVAGPMCDVRNDIGAHYIDRAMGTLERLLGVQLAYSVPDRKGMLNAAWNDGTPLHGENWYELYDTGEAQSLAHITAGYSSLVGKSVIMKKQVGKGVVILLGTLPTAEDWDRLISLAVDCAGVQGVRMTGDLAVVPRRGNGREGLLVAECTGSTGSVALSEPMRDILSGKLLEGTVQVKPFELLILEK